jgi:hypothetical protein
MVDLFLRWVVFHCRNIPQIIHSAVGHFSCVLMFWLLYIMLFGNILVYVFWQT